MGAPIRIGLIVPSTNTTAESDFQRACPPGVSTHSARLWVPSTHPDEDMMDRMNEGLEEAAKSLASAKVDYLVYACTTGSFYKGVGDDHASIEKMRKASGGVPATVTALAGVEALRHLGAKRVSAASPYNEWQNGRLRAYLEEQGFEVLNVEGDRRGAAVGAQGHNELSPESALAFASAVCKPEADALFCSCAAWRTMEVVGELERATGKPVVTANQATVWVAFRDLGIQPKRGFGSLLDSMVLAPA